MTLQWQLGGGKDTSSTEKYIYFCQDCTVHYAYLRENDTNRNIRNGTLMVRYI